MLHSQMHTVLIYCVMISNAYSYSNTVSLYNDVSDKDSIPQIWRHSIIIPVLKTGREKQYVSSYRPVSLTTTIGKIMEKLVTYLGWYTI